MGHSLHRGCLLLWACVAIVVQARPAAADSTVVTADSVMHAAATDSTQRLEPAWAWRHWPPIDTAIHIAPLDGPQDILEKEEIVADRVDALTQEAARLDTLTITWQARHLAMTAQLEVLEDLADMQLGGDLEVQQRMESVREDAQHAAQQVSLHSQGLQALHRERQRLLDLAANYRQRAAQLRAEEEDLR